MTVEMQFIDKHKKLYLELHRDLAKQEYAPQSEASLINFQTLLLLEIALLMGCDLDWGTANPEGASGGAAIQPHALLSRWPTVDPPTPPLPLIRLRRHNPLLAPPILRPPPPPLIPFPLCP